MLRLLRARNEMPTPNGSCGAATTSTSMPRSASSVEQKGPGSWRERSSSLRCPSAARDISKSVPGRSPRRPCRRGGATRGWTPSACPRSPHPAPRAAAPCPRAGGRGAPRWRAPGWRAVRHDTQRDAVAAALVEEREARGVVRQHAERGALLAVLVVEDEAGRAARREAERRVVLAVVAVEVEL